MATTNYIKVRTAERCHEFFFDARDPVAVETARNAAWAYVDALLFVVGKKGVHVSVWDHSPEFPGVTCVGGCATCSPAQPGEVEP